MYKKNLDKIIEQYIVNFDYLNRSEAEGGADEGYKWRVISAFKHCWNIDAPDFAAMLQEAMGDISKTNLINNSMVQPVTGLITLAKLDGEAEFVREEFKKLLSEDNGDLDARGERVNDFIDNINGRINEKFNGSWKFQQPRNAVIFYLNLWRPEDNYLFKATEAKEWADCIEFDDDFGSGSSFSLKKYYKMCDELRGALNDYPEVLELNKARVEKEAVGYNDDNHLLAFDIIYCSHYMSFYKECPSLGISTKERIKIARRREQIEAIENEIIEKKKEIEILEQQIKPVPNLVGQIVTHKMFGDGTITNQNEEYLTVDFKTKTSKFSTDAIVRGFLTLPEKQESILKDNDELAKKIAAINNRLKALFREKDKIE